MERAVRAALPARRPLRALEVGGGAGGGFRRWMRLLDGVDFELTATDGNPELLRAYREAAAGFPVRFRAAEVPGGFGGERWDLLLARSFWDLLPAGAAFDFARGVLAPGGVFYAALTFAGETRFDPPHESDAPVLDAYHRSMAAPRAGELLTEDAPGFAGVASGRSDWRVVPRDGGYPGDEAYFLRTILGFIEKEVGERAADWLETRRRQLREATLAFEARQLDVAARRISPRAAE